MADTTNSIADFKRSQDTNTSASVADFKRQQEASTDASLAGTQKLQNTGSNTNVQNTEITEEQKKTAVASKGKLPDNANVFYVDVLVFLEGVQVPHTNCSVSYGISGESTATITLPAANFLRYLPSTTKVLICFKDLCIAPGDTEPKYRVMFEGEVASVNYEVTTNGANITISAHSVASYLHLMQLTQQGFTGALQNHAALSIGDIVFLSAVPGQNTMSCDILKQIINQQSIKTTADIAYRIIKNIFAYKDQPTCNVAKWYYNKLGDCSCGYKLLDRIYNVSPEAKAAPTVSQNYDVGGTLANGGGSFGSAYNSDYDSNSPTTTKVNIRADKNGTYSEEIIRACNNHLGKAEVISASCARNVTRVLQKCSSFLSACPLLSTIIKDTSNYDWVPNYCAAAKKLGILKDPRTYSPYAGDIIIWHNYNSDGMDHIGIVDGDGGDYDFSYSATNWIHRKSIANYTSGAIQYYIAIANYGGRELTTDEKIANQVSSPGPEDVQTLA